MPFTNSIDYISYGFTTIEYGVFPTFSPANPNDRKAGKKNEVENG